MSQGGLFMKKIIFANLDILARTINGYDLSAYRDDFLTRAKALCSNGENVLVFESMHYDRLNKAKEIFQTTDYPHFNFMTRNEVKTLVTTNRDKNNMFVFLSGKEQDFHVAVQTKALFIVPTWIPSDEKSMYYGIHVDTPAQLFKFIKTLNNQNHWFARFDIEPNVTAFSLMDARYGYYAKNQEEREMLKHFEGLLKEGIHRNYYDILLYHFIAGMTNTTLFDDIELFGMIPSSNCCLNQDMHMFMTQVRYIKGKRLPKNGMQYDNLLIRHTQKRRAHEAYSGNARVNLKATDEFNTMIINPDFKNKIQKLRKENKFNVMVFDDYMTHGNTFNAVRNLLKAEGVNKIIFVSLGSFSQPFQKNDYSITGSVYQPGYTAVLKKTEVLYNYVSQAEAKQEVAELYDIFNA